MTPTMKRLTTICVALAAALAVPASAMASRAVPGGYRTCSYPGVFHANSALGINVRSQRGYGILGCGLALGALGSWEKDQHAKEQEAFANIAYREREEAQERVNSNDEVEYLGTPPKPEQQAHWGFPSAFTLTVGGLYSGDVNVPAMQFGCRRFYPTLWQCTHGRIGFIFSST
jgi:hypothetical protein